MSSGQALAAAQRRRAGGAKNAPAAPPRQTQTHVKPNPKAPVSLEALVSSHDRQLFDVGRYIVSNDEHWRDSDEMLRILSERCDTISNARGESSTPRPDGDALKALEDKVTEAVTKSASREEVMELLGNVRQDMDTNLNKAAKLEGEVTKLRSIIMQLQKDVSSLKDSSAEK